MQNVQTMMERIFITAAMKMTDDNVVRAARLFGINTKYPEQKTQGDDLKIV